ncbi:MAG: MFS transporter [Dehalococcoidia bacterium]
MSSAEATSPASEAPAHRSPFFYGWWLVVGGFSAMALNGALLFHAFGSYVVLLKDDFGWSGTAFAVAFALQRVETGLLGPVDGWFVDRFGPRRMMIIGLTVHGLGFLMLSQVNSLAMFYVAFLVIALGGAMGSFLPASVAVVNWFSRRRATALAVMMLGLAAGGLVQPLVVLGLEELGWRGMAFLSGVIVILAGAPIGLLFRHHPEPYGWEVDGAAPQPRPAPPASSASAPAEVTRLSAEVNFTARQALRTRAFWLIGVGHGLSLLVTGAVMVHFQAHVRDSLGYSLGTAAGMITLMTVMQVLGQVAGGYFGDRLSKRLLIVVAMVLSSAGLIMLAAASALWMVAAFAVLNGLGFGARIPLTTAIRADYFGGRNYGVISGFNSMVVTVGIIAGPVIAGAAFDATGSYVRAFTGLAIVAGLGSLCFIFLRKPDPPDETEGTRHRVPQAVVAPSSGS